MGTKFNQNYKFFQHFAVLEYLKLLDLKTASDRTFLTWNTCGPKNYKLFIKKKGILLFSWDNGNVGVSQFFAKFSINTYKEKTNSYNKNL